MCLFTLFDPGTNSYWVNSKIPKMISCFPWSHHLVGLCSKKTPISFSRPPSFLLLKVEVLVAQLCLTLCDLWTITCQGGASAHEVLQARILVWIAIPFSRGSSWPHRLYLSFPLIGWDHMATFQSMQCGSDLFFYWNIITLQCCVSSCFMT